MVSTPGNVLPMSSHCYIVRLLLSVMSTPGIVSPMSSHCYIVRPLLSVMSTPGNVSPMSSHCYIVRPLLSVVSTPGIVTPMSSHCFLQYLTLVRQLEGYGELSFPHCGCDSRKGGHVIPVVSFESFKLQACKEDGTLEVCPHSQCSNM